ncbi:MAG: alpha/beta fold hydrolase [Candidatus Omnitrophica bacterium]|nr:alpha/beta fold hydrolase [Candidatus Omnitrophota bacterium]
MNETELFVTSGDGVKISIRHCRGGKKAAVVIAPGFFTGKDTRTYRRLEGDLKDVFDVVSMDFRGHGRSEGRYAYSAKEKEDLKAVIGYARDSGHKKIGVLGFSYGGAIAILEAAEYKDVDSLVCAGSPMASGEIEFKWWTWEGLKLGLWRWERGKGVRSGNPFLAKVRPLDVVASVSPIPILFIHGTGDPTVDVRHSRMLYEAAREPKAIKIFEKGSHAEEIYRRFPAEFIQTVKEWFGKTLEEGAVSVYN